MYQSISQPMLTSEIKPQHWLIALSFAALAHGLLFLGYSPVEDTAGAQSYGERGISIGLKNIPIKAKPITTPKPKPKHKPKPRHKPKAIVIPVEAAEFKPITEEVVEADEMQVKEEETVEGGGNPGLKATYEAHLVAWLERHKHYPASARRRHQEDKVILEFILNASGELLHYQIIQASRFGSLNRAVEKMVKRAAPMPPVPKELHTTSNEYSYVIPVDFHLK